MTAPRSSRVVRFAEGRDFSVSRLGLGAASAVGALLYLVALHGASGGFDSVIWALVPLAAVLLPVADSGFPLGYWGFMLVLWVWHTEPGTVSGWAALAAVGLVLSHAALALSTTAPSVAAVSRASISRWGRRAALACVPAALLAVGAGTLDALGGSAGAVVVVAALVAVSLGTAWLRSAPPADEAG